MDVISVKDYPRSRYSAYWEIEVDAKTNKWAARLYDYATNTVLVEQRGAATGMEAARHASQTWVKSQMDQHKRA
jgi:hypothetical protein